jgi:CheY-like chemotaxis protein
MNRTGLSLSPALALHAVDVQPSLKILLAEENREMRKLVACVLRGDGHDVVETANGGELLEAIASLIIDRCRHHVDIIMCEQSMPGIQGLSVLSGLRARGRSTPFILVTRNAMAHVSARQLGAVILEKPLNVESIRDAVHQAQQSTPPLAACP